MNNYFFQLHFSNYGYLQAISCNMPVKVNLWPLGSVNSWATNTNKARMEKTHASTEVAWIVWMYSESPQWQKQKHTVSGMSKAI